MINASELIKIGKNLSEDFVTNGVDLTSGLQKVASDNGLNTAQIHRVAETANVETYLAMMKTADEKYLDFKVADPLSVRQSMKKEASVPFAGTHDYDNSADTNVSVETIFDLYSQRTKMASEVPEASNDAEIRKLADHTQGQIAYVSNLRDEATTTADTCYQNLYKTAKQLVLGDIPFPEVEKVIKEASVITSTPIVEEIREKLASIAPHKDLDKDRDNIKECGAPNTETDLYKHASALEDSIIDVVKHETILEKLYDKYASLAEDNALPNLYKHAVKSPSVQFLKATKELIKAHKLPAVLGLGYIGGKAIGKAEGKAEQGEVLQKAMLKKRRGY